MSDYRAAAPARRCEGPLALKASRHELSQPIPLIVMNNFAFHANLRKSV